MTPRRMALTTLLIALFTAAAVVEIAREDLDATSVAVLTGIGATLGVVWTLTKGPKNGE